VVSWRSGDVADNVANSPREVAVTLAMVERLEAEIDALSEEIEMPKEFVVPARNRYLRRSTLLARSSGSGARGVSYPSMALGRRYLNRLSDLHDHGPIRGGPITNNSYSRREGTE